MFRLLTRWWTAPFDYAAMPGYMTRRDLADPYRRMLGTVVLTVVCAGAMVLLTDAAPASAAARALFLGCLITGAASGVAWWVGPWPSRRRSLLFLFGSDLLLAAALTCLTSVQAAFTFSVVFALLGMYCGYFHSVRTQVAHVALTVAVSVGFFAAATLSEESDPALMAVLLIVQLALFVMAPLLSQIPLSHLRDDAYHSGLDPLTGTLNRRGLTTTSFAPLLARSGDDAMVAVMVIDLDRFKAVNDQLGHAGGDEVLRVVSDRLRERGADRAIVARLGGEEFCVVGVVSGDEVADRYEWLHAAVHDADDPVPVTASAGVVWMEARRWQQDCEHLETMLRRADRLMYEAKRAGGDSVRFDERVWSDTEAPRT